MKYRIVVGVLVLVLVISLGFNAYLYSAMVNRQATINDMQGRIIVAWAGQMAVASWYLQNVTTNIEMVKVTSLFRMVSQTAKSAWVADGGLYHRMVLAASFADNYLSHYCEGAPTNVKHINSTAITMIKQLVQEIQNTTKLIIGSGGLSLELENLNGVDPLHLLKEKGILDQIISGCSDIQNLSIEISEFNPKFQQFP